MDRFLVQVNKDGGYNNITSNRRYENHLWMKMPRDKDHGEVKPGDELVIYCTGSVPNHRMSLSFGVAVVDVSSDNVTFELAEPRWFRSPLKLQRIHDLVSQKKLPEEFRKCGQQGFNIAKLDPNTAESVLGLLDGVEPSGTAIPEQGDPQDYTIKNIIRDGCFLEEARLVAIQDRLKTKKNLILQGPPGTGKTWLAKKLAFALIGRRSKRRVQPFQFHPSLSYEDFVRGWRPGGDGKLDLVDGPFLKAIEDSKDDPSNDYVVVIEEINRGNSAQIFGEMLTLLEADKRNPEEALVLSYPKDPGERVHIPPNLHIIGTMNVADRSLALVDFALRRRFAFIDLEPAFGDIWRNWVSAHCQIDTAFLADIEGRLKSLNQTITEDITLGPQFRVGHSVVTPTGTTPVGDPQEWFRQVVETEIGPLLDEYWFDNPNKARSERKTLLEGLIY